MLVIKKASVFEYKSGTSEAEKISLLVSAYLDSIMMIASY